MKIIISGGTGLIGTKLTNFFRKKGHHITILTRQKLKSNKNLQYVQWLAPETKPEIEILRADVWINLAGTSINAGRWGKRHQREIYESRMIATDEVLRLLEILPEKPKVLINASAIGIYPPSLDATYTEKATEVAADFLGKTVADWEKKALHAEHLGIRTVLIRFGVVLDQNAGALPLMVLPYLLFAGGTIGSGNQWVSWVHIEDVVRAIDFVIGHSNIKGPVNVTAPEPVSMREFGKTIGKVLNRPHWFPVPGFLMRLVLG